MTTGSRSRFYEDRAALVELPSGAVLETDEHPSRYSPTMGYIGLFALGGASSAVGRGVGAGRRHGFWRESPPERSALGPGVVLCLAEMLGALAQTVAGAARWVGLTGALVGAGLGWWAVVRSRRRAG